MIFDISDFDRLSLKLSVVVFLFKLQLLSTERTELLILQKLDYQTLPSMLIRHHYINVGGFHLKRMSGVSEGAMGESATGVQADRRIELKV